MHLLKRAALCCLVVLPLAACATTPGGVSTVPTARLAFDQACANEPLVYAAFVLATVVRPVSDRTARSVEAAHAEAVRICADPPADLAAGLVALTRAYVAVQSARDDHAKRRI